VAAVADALQDPHPPVRALAAAVLFQLGPEARAALPRLLQRLTGDNPGLQAQAFTAALTAGSVRDGCLLDALAAANERAGWAASLQVTALVDRREWVSTLLRGLDDPHPTRRLAAVLALGRLGPEAKAAAGRLGLLVKDPDRAVQAAALLVLAADPPRQTDAETAAVRIGALVDELKSAKRRDPEALVRLYILTSAVSSAGGPAGAHGPTLATAVRRARDWAAQAVANLPASPRTLLVLIQGVNVTAAFHLGFTEPFGRLHLTLQCLLRETRDADLLSRALRLLGEGVRPNSPYGPALTLNRAHAQGNPALLEAQIEAKAKRVEALQRQVERRAVAVSQVKLRADLARARATDALGRLNQAWDERLLLLGWDLQYLVRDRQGRFKYADDFSDPANKLPLAQAMGGPPAPPWWALPGKLPPMTPFTFMAVSIPSSGPALMNDPREWLATRPVMLASSNSAAQAGRAAQAERPLQRQLELAGPEQEALARELAELSALRALQQLAALGKVGAEFREVGDNAAALCQRLQDPEPLARWYAATLLGARRIHAEADLIQALSDPVGEVREAARQALVRLSRGADFGPRAGDPPARVQEAVQRWNRWLALQQPNP
jgi:hypothetical protein